MLLKNQSLINNVLKFFNVNFNSTLRKIIVNEINLIDPSLSKINFIFKES